MSDNLTVLIAGASRGIGKGLAASYLSRPRTTVVAGVRDPTSAASQSLHALPRGAGSALVLVRMDVSSEPSVAAAVASLRSEHGVQALDVVVANAAMGALTNLVDAPTAVLRAHVETNAFGALWLFKETVALLRKAGGGRPGRFVAVSTDMASCALVVDEGTGRVPLGPYGASKALLNYFVRRLAAECADVVVVAVHPGSVGTESAKKMVKELGVEDFSPLSVEESVAAMTKIIDEATIEKTSGHFLKYTGEEMPW